MDAEGENESFLLGEWLVEPELNRIVRGEEIVKVDPRNMRLLQLLATRPKQVISQAEIEQAVWSDVIVTSNSVYQSIAQLRRALGDEKANPRYIETIARKGYRLVGGISPAPIGTHGSEMPVHAPASHSGRLWFLVQDRTARVVLLLVAVGIGAGAGAISESFRGNTRPDDALKAGLVTTDVPQGPDPGFLYASRHVPQSPHSRSQMLTELSLAANDDGRPHDSLAYAQKAVELERRASGDKSLDTADRLAILALAYHWLGDYEAAERTGREAVQLFKASPAMYPTKSDAFRYLADILIDRGKFGEATAYLEQAIELNDRQYGQASGRSAQSRCSLVALWNLQGLYSEAEKLARQLLLNEAVGSSYRSYEVNIRSELGYSLLMQGRHREAKLESERVLDVSLQLLRQDHPYVASAYELLGRSLIGLREYGQAEHTLSHAMAIWRETGGWTWRVGRSASALGEALLGQGRMAEAENYLAYASRALESAPNGQLEQLAVQDHKARLQKLAAAKERHSRITAKFAEPSDL